MPRHPLRVTFPFALLLSLAAMLGHPERAQACSCIEPLPVAETLELAGAVFSGQIVDVLRDQDGMRRYRMELDRVWKGDLRPIETIESGQGDGDCGFLFQEGEAYLVYAHSPGHSGSLSTNTCIGTMRLTRATNDVAELDRLAPPRAPTGTAEQTSPPIGLITLALLALVLGALVILRGRSQDPRAD